MTSTLIDESGESYRYTGSTETLFLPPKHKPDIKISPSVPESVPESAVTAVGKEWIIGEGLSLEYKYMSVREVTIEEAKRMIYEFLETHDSQSIYPSEVADRLGLDLKTTVRAVDELLKEEKVEVAD